MCDRRRPAWAPTLTCAEGEPPLTGEPLLRALTVVIFAASVKRVLDRAREVFADLHARVVRRVVQNAMLPRGLWQPERAVVKRVEYLLIEIMLKHGTAVQAGVDV